MYALIENLFFFFLVFTALRIEPEFSDNLKSEVKCLECITNAIIVIITIIYLQI